MKIRIITKIYIPRAFQRVLEKIRVAQNEVLVNQKFDVTDFFHRTALNKASHKKLLETLPPTLGIIKDEAFCFVIKAVFHTT